jgi:hypothetical protein
VLVDNCLAIVKGSVLDNEVLSVAVATIIPFTNNLFVVPDRVTATYVQELREMLDAFGS